MRVLFVWPNMDSFGFKPIGLSLLIALAKRENWTVQLFDATGFDLSYSQNTKTGEQAKQFKPVNLEQYGHIKDSRHEVGAAFELALRDFSPDLVAISCLSDEVELAAKFTRVSKTVFPETPVIWGGKYPTIRPLDSLLKHGADFVCVGEGLEAFPEFLEAIQHDSNKIYNIQNIWSLRNGAIVQTPIRPILENIDSVPYVDWAYFATGHMYKPFDGAVYRGGDHMLNWGCPYRCTYCINGFLHDLYENRYVMRRYSTRRIIDELKFLKEKYQLEFFRFHDEDFLMRPLKNFIELAEAYAAEVNLPFSIETNPKSVTFDKVQLLKQMNCVSASVAIETGTPFLRKEILNRVDNETDIMRAFSLLRDSRIRTVSFNLLGIPFETRESFNATVELNRKADVQYPQMGVFYPFEGTIARKTAIQNGFLDEFYSAPYDRKRVALHFDWATEKQILALRDTFVLYVKLPMKYHRFIRRSEQDDTKGQILRNILMEVFELSVWKNDGWYRPMAAEEEFMQKLSDIHGE
jgi:anaerobic magnesium-protoporphyrin IX monomethyl ester cyclase